MLCNVAYPYDDSGDIAELLTRSSTHILDKYAPLKTVTVKPRTSNPWFTSSLRSERGIRRQLERTWRKTRKESDKLAYKKQCHLYNSKVKKAQSDYFSSLFKSNSNTKEL